MFDAISVSFRGIISRLGNAKTITPQHLEDVIEDIRNALLEADVALSVVNKFTANLRQKIIGQSVLKGVKASDMIIKLTQDEITALLGEPFKGVELAQKPLVVMMLGLQGSGKTTSTAKLGLFLKKKKSVKPFLISLDMQRPAAQEQIETLAVNNGLGYLKAVPNENVMDKLQRGLAEAKDYGADLIFLDTAGRLQIDEGLMSELVQIETIARPHEKILVLDSLIGRESINISRGFGDKIAVTGVILTRVDGDGRGGVALNVKDALGVQIKYLGTGEKIQEFEEFHPDRIASRILDMGDIVSLVEKTQEEIDEAEVARITDKIKAGTFDLNDLLTQIRGMKKMGGMSKILGFLPGMSAFKQYVKDATVDDSFFAKQEAMILSMTKWERANPLKLVNSSSRKARIATGAGLRIIDVNQLLKRFQDIKQMMGKVGDFDLEGTDLKSLAKMMMNAKSAGGGFNMQNLQKMMQDENMLKNLQNLIKKPD
jgi:signal recognition particle subunit SRP54